MVVADLLATRGALQSWRERGWPGPHYDDYDDCPCPDHRAMRAERYHR